MVSRISEYSDCLRAGHIHITSPSRALEDGDIVNVDITVYLSGYHGDTSRTFLVGQVVR